MSQSNLLSRIEEYIEYLRQMFNTIHARDGHVGSPPVPSATYSEKWCKISRTSGGSESVYAFVALQDFETKGLGVIQAGDIHKPASWKAPSKRARGSIFSDNFGDCSEYYSIRYLRGG